MNEIYEKIDLSGQDSEVKKELRILADALKSIGYSPTQINEELQSYIM